MVPQIHDFSVLNIDSCSPVFLWSKKIYSIDMFSVNQLFERLLPQSCSAVVDELYNLFKSVSKRLKKCTCRTCRIGNSSPITTEPVESPKRSSLEACLVHLGLLPALLIYQCLCLRGTFVVSKVNVTSVVSSETVSYRLMDPVESSTAWSSHTFVSGF